jgi:hypothetical protein
MTVDHKKRKPDGILGVVSPETNKINAPSREKASQGRRVLD